MIRGLVAALAIGSLIAYLIWPERQEDLALLPTESGLVLGTVTFAVVAVVLAAGTRRASK
ncbi:MAG: hypothetical protein ABWX92_13620 [Mycetocola sp.]